MRFAISADTIGGAVSHYRDERGLEVDGIVDLPDGRWAVFDVKLGGEARIEEGAAHLKSLAAKVSEKRAATLAGLSVITAGTTSFVRPDGIKVVSLGHLRAG